MVQRCLLYKIRVAVGVEAVGLFSYYSSPREQDRRQRKRGAVARHAKTAQIEISTHDDNWGCLEVSWLEQSVRCGARCAALIIFRAGQGNARRFCRVITQLSPNTTFYTTTHLQHYNLLYKTIKNQPKQTTRSTRPDHSPEKMFRTVAQRTVASIRTRQGECLPRPFALCLVCQGLCVVSSCLARRHTPRSRPTTRAVVGPPSRCAAPAAHIHVHHQPPHRSTR
jgi:hypothetical protein